MSSGESRSRFNALCVAQPHPRLRADLTTFRQPTWPTRTSGCRSELLPFLGLSPRMAEGHGLEQPPTLCGAQRHIPTRPGGPGAENEHEFLSSARRTAPQCQMRKCTASTLALCSPSQLYNDVEMSAGRLRTKSRTSQQRWTSALVRSQKPISSVPY